MSVGHDFAMRLRAAYLTLHRRANAAFAPAGVTADQFVLLALLAAEGGVAQVELVRRSSSDPNTLRAMLVLLESRGLVRRVRDAADGRARLVSLTPAGRRVHDQAVRAADAFHTAVAAVFPPADRERLGDAFAHLAAALSTPPQETADETDAPDDPVRVPVRRTGPRPTAEGPGRA